MSRRFSVEGSILNIVEENTILSIDLNSVERLYKDTNEIFIYCRGMEFDVTGVDYKKLLSCWSHAKSIGGISTRDITDRLN